jgi:hypothetical protein
MKLYIRNEAIANVNKDNKVHFTQGILQKLRQYHNEGYKICILLNINEKMMIDLMLIN